MNAKIVAHVGMPTRLMFRTANTKQKNRRFNMISQIGKQGYIQGQPNSWYKVEVVDVLKDAADRWQLRVKPISGSGTSVVYPKQLRRLV